MANLNVVITGDCEGAVSALSNTTAAVEKLDGTGAVVGVQLRGNREAITGLAGVGSAASDLDGTTATLRVDSGGIVEARGQLGGLRADVRSATREMDSLAGARALGFSDGGTIRQLASDLATAGRAASSFGASFAGGMREADTAGRDVARSVAAVGSAVSAADRSVSSFAATLGGTTSGLSNFERAGQGAATASSAVAQAGARAETAIGGVGSAASSAAAPVQQMASSAVALAEHSAVATNALSDMESGLGGIERQATLSARQVAMVSSALNSSGLQQGMATFGAVSGGGPPPSVGGGRGGGGGGGGGGGAGRSAAASDDSGGLSGLHGLARTGLMGLMGGAVDEMIGAGAGIASVMATVKQVPALAAAGTAAMSEFNKAVGAAGASAASEGVPAFQRLGAALGGLGKEVGTVGAAQLGNVLSGATELAGTATTALTNMAPAIGPAILGATNLGNALLAGIGSPQVVAAVKSVGEGLQGAGAATAVTTLTSALLSSGGVITRVAEDAISGLGDVLNLVGGPSAGAAAGPAVLGGVLGATQLSKLYGGGAQGGIAGAISGASALAMGAQAQQAGNDPGPGVLANIGAAMGGTRMFGPVAGSMLGAGAQYATNQVQKIPGSGDAGVMLGDILAGAGAGLMLGGPVGMAAGAVGGAGVGLYQAIQDHANSTGGFTPGTFSAGGGAAATPGAFPTGPSAPAAGKYGWTQDASGNLTPSNTPGGGGGQLAGGPPVTTPTLPSPVGTPINPSQIPSSMLAPPPQVAGAAQPGLMGLFGSGAGSLNPSQIQQLSSSLPAAASGYSALGSSAASATTGMATSTQQVQNQTQSLSGLSQAANNSAAPVQQATQTAQAATQAHQQLAQAAPQTVAAVQQVAPAATQAMTQATTAVQSGGASLGAQIPQSMGSGIAAQTAQACNASAQLAQSTAACAASTLKAASPSQVFVGFGEGMGQGLAIGAKSSAADAQGAVGEMMKGVVESGRSALNAHSPSLEFVTLGAGIGAGLRIGVMRAADGTIESITNMTEGMVDAHSAAWDPEPNALPKPEAAAWSPELSKNVPSSLVRQNNQPPPPPPTDPMDDLNNTLARQNAAVMPQQQLTAIQQQNLAHGGSGGGSGGGGGGANPSPTPLGMADLAALQKNLAERGMSPGTVDTVTGYLQKKQDILNKTMEQRDANHLAAQLKVGMTGYTSGVDNPFNPKSQNKAQAYQAMVDRRSISTEAVLSGRTPNQVMADSQNAKLGAGPSEGPSMGSAAPGMKTQADAQVAAGKPMAGHSGPSAGFGYNNYAWGLGQSGMEQEHRGTTPWSMATPGGGGGKMAGEAPGAADGGGAGASAAGNNFAGSFAGGISGAAHTAFDSASNLAAGAVNAVTNLLGIKSPSRVMAGHGEMSSEGFGRGIRDGAHGPFRAMREMVREAMEGGRNEWEHGWRNWGGPPAWATSGGGGGSSSGGGSGGGGGGGGGGWSPWWWGHHGRHHGHHGHHGDHHGDRDRDDDDRGDGDHEGHGGGGHGGDGDRDWDRMAEHFADRLGDRLGGRFGHGGGGGGHGDGHGWGGGSDHWFHDGGWGWGGGSGGGSGGSGSGGGYPMGPWGWSHHMARSHAFHRGWGHEGWGEHGDHDRHRDRDDDRHHGEHERERHGRHDDHDRQFDHIARDTLPTLSGQAVAMGMSITTGMSVGMQQGSSVVTQAANQVAQRAVAQAKSTLGIASPSAVFYQIGLDSAEGFHLGMGRGMHGFENHWDRDWGHGGRHHGGDHDDDHDDHHGGGHHGRRRWDEWGFHASDKGIGVAPANAGESLGAITAQQLAEGMRTGVVDAGYQIGLNSNLDRYRVKPNMMDFDEWYQAEQLVGGLGSGLAAATGGIQSIASSSGLQVGSVWARNIVTGAQNVLQTSLYSALTVPSIGSAFAKAQLGAAGLLPPAGSGAEYYNTAQGNAGMVTMPPVTIPINMTVSLDGQPFQQLTVQAISRNNIALVDSINAQRGS